MAAHFQSCNSNDGRHKKITSPRRKLRKMPKEDSKDHHMAISDSDDLVNNMAISDSDDLVNKINSGTKKCTTVIHLKKPLHNYPQQSGCEDESAIELPTLLQCNTQHLNPTKRSFHFKKMLLKDIFRDSKKRMWLFFGSGGSGKTTLLKTVARHTMNRVYEGLRGISIVIFLKCGDLSTEKHTSLYKLLLSNMEPEIEGAELVKFKEIIREDPSKLLIVMDGLDMLPRNFYLKSIHQSPSSNMENASVADILVALLTSRCLPGCRIVASSQTLEIFQKIPELIVEMIPVQLTGLTDESIYNIARQHLEQSQAQQLVQLLESRPSLFDLCRTPVFLIATVLGQTERPSFMPSNVSDTLIYLVGQFIRSGDCKVDDNEVKKLGKIAFSLLGDGKFDFNPDLLSDYQEIRDRLSGLLREAHSKTICTVSFVHQSIHEMFATLHLVGLERSYFEKEITSCISQDQFSFVFQYLGGLLCNETTFALASGFGLVHEDDDWQYKRKYFLGLLHRRVDELTHSQCNPSVVLSTIHMLNECGYKTRNIVASNLKKICISSYPLSLTDVHALSSVATSSLDELALSSCALELLHLQMLSGFFMNNTRKVRKLDLSHNNLTLDAVKLAGMIAGACSTEELDISGTASIQDDDSALLSLKDGLGDHKLKILKINYSDADLKEKEMSIDSKEKNVEYVYKLVHNEEDWRVPMPLPNKITHCVQFPGSWKTASYDVTRAIEKLLPNATESIHVRCWKFSEEWKELLQNNLKANNRQNLQIVLSSHCVIQYNGDPSSPSIGKDKHDKEMVDMLSSTEVDSKSTCDEIENVPNVVAEESHEQVEDLAYRIAHRRVNNNDLKAFGLKIATHDKLEEIELRECGLSVDFLRNMLNEVKSSKDGIQVKKLSITAENNVAELIPAICQLMLSCGTSDLNLEESDGSVTMVKILHEHIKKLKIQLKVLNLSYIENMGDFQHLGILLSDRVCQLHLVNCNLNLSSLESLQCITNSKVEYLDISYNPEIDDDSIRLIPNILCKKKRISLLMQGCELDDFDVDAFKEFDDIQLQLLDLSHNETLESGGIKKVGEFADVSQVKKLRLSSCGLDDECITTLTSSLHQKLDELDLSENPGVACCANEMASLISNSKLSNLKLGNCKLIHAQIRDLATSMEQHAVKLKQIDIRDRNRRCWDEKYFAAVELLSSHVEDKLLLCLPTVKNNEHSIQEHSLPWIKQFSERMVIHVEWI